MSDWLILAATLPTHPSALRVRVWRALKATGAGALREGVHLLPTAASTAPALHALGRTIVEAGADAHLLEVVARDPEQELAFKGLFDREELHVEFQQTVKEARGEVPAAGEATLQRTLRLLEQRHAALCAIDFFPAAPAARSADMLAALRRETLQRLSPDEPVAHEAEIERCAREDFQGRTWATRRRPWVDRLATAWLVARHVDRAPTFLWLADAKACPQSALGYDFDGARFTHVGERVSFEVVARSFGLDADPALARLGALVHAIDVGGAPVEETAGIEMVVRGLQARHADDDALLAAGLDLFDTLFAAQTAKDAR